MKDLKTYLIFIPLMIILPISYIGLFIDNGDKDKKLKEEEEKNRNNWQKKHLNKIDELSKRISKLDSDQDELINRSLQLLNSNLAILASKKPQLLDIKIDPHVNKADMPKTGNEIERVASSLDALVQLEKADTIFKEKLISSLIKISDTLAAEHNNAKLSNIESEIDSLRFELERFKRRKTKDVHKSKDDNSITRNFFGFLNKYNYAFAIDNSFRHSFKIHIDRTKIHSGIELIFHNNTHGTLTSIMHDIDSSIVSNIVVSIPSGLNCHKGSSFSCYINLPKSDEVLSKKVKQKFLLEKKLNSSIEKIYLEIVIFFDQRKTYINAE